MISLVILACVFSANVIDATRKSYEGYQIWTVYPSSQQHLDLLYSIRNEVDISVTKLINIPTEMMIAPEHVPKYRRILKENDIAFEVDDENIQKSLEKTYARLDAKLAYDPNDYNTVEDVHSELDRLAGECAEGITCESRVIGQSYEGRDIKMFSMTKTGENRVSHYLDSLTHAREWLAGATVMRMLDYLVTGYGSSDDVTYLVDTYDFYFVPIVNPDGYQYTFDTNRFWRKSRNVNTGSNCLGTDLNRNFDFFWGDVGSSNDPCSDTYRGSGPASESEIQTIQDFAQTIASSTISALSVHTTAYVWLSPYGYAEQYFQCNRPEDHDDIDQVGRAAVRAIEDTNGDNWQAGTACEVLYEANGVTVDYMYSVGIKYSYTPELRGPGFDPPPRAIQPSFEEVWAGYVAMITEIESIEGL